MSLSEAIERARNIHLTFGRSALVFNFRTPTGEEWEGCLDEWIGSGNFHTSDADVVEHDGRHYIAVGASGGGADLVLIRDDGIVCYLNDFDGRISEIAESVDRFVALLRNSPE